MVAMKSDKLADMPLLPNLIDPGGKTINDKTCFHRFQFFDFERLGSIATDILSRKRGAAAAWYAGHSNTSLRIFNSGREI